MSNCPCNDPLPGLDDYTLDELAELAEDEDEDKEPPDLTARRIVVTFNAIPDDPDPDFIDSFAPPDPRDLVDLLPFGWNAYSAEISVVPMSEFLT